LNILTDIPILPQIYTFFAHSLLYLIKGVLCRQRIFSIDFMRKYLYIAKCLVPTLTDEVRTALAEEYASLRSQDQVDSDIARVGGC
jgi:DNA replicative helicase MCM subunit Mcm2 (Cdc46/Mcm family)